MRDKTKYRSSSQKFWSFQCLANCRQYQILTWLKASGEASFCCFLAGAQLFGYEDNHFTFFSWGWFSDGLAALLSSIPLCAGCTDAGNNEFDKFIPCLLSAGATLFPVVGTEESGSFCRCFSLTNLASWNLLSTDWIILSPLWEVEPRREYVRLFASVCCGL